MGTACLIGYFSVTECIVPGHDPITLSFRSFSFLIGWGFYGLIYLRCSKLCAGPAASLSPSVPAEARCLVC